MLLPEASTKTGRDHAWSSLFDYNLLLTVGMHFDEFTSGQHCLTNFYFFKEIWDSLEFIYGF